MELPRVRSIAEADVIIRGQQIRLDALEKLVIDLTQRMDTMQTPIWRRVWFWVDGWPWYNLNGERRHRPWHRQ